MKPFSSSSRPRAWVLASGLLWVGALGYGFWALSVHAFTPALAGPASPDWPSASTLGRPTHHYTLVVAAHPECPCSAATVDELETILAGQQDRVTTFVLFLDEPGLPVPADQSNLWRRTLRIGGVQLIKDPQGKELRRFGALASGETRLYGSQGELLFHGGITASRGHRGDNPGESALIALLSGKADRSTPRSTPTFGCALFNAPVASASLRP